MPEFKESIKTSRIRQQAEQSPEHVLNPEKFLTKQTEGSQEKAVENLSPIVPVVLPSQTDVVGADEKTIVLKKVENILSKNMDNVFLSMDAATQQQFKIKGEETAQKIVILLNKTKIRIREVLSLIISWLRIIPHVNRFYLEQEAKIKADEIIKMHQNK